MFLYIFDSSKQVRYRYIDRYKDRYTDIKIDKNKF